jgi:hypothetical protein
MNVIIRKTGTRGTVVKSEAERFFVKLADGRHLWYERDALLFVD